AGAQPSDHWRVAGRANDDASIIGRLGDGCPTVQLARASVGIDEEAVGAEGRGELTARVQKELHVAAIVAAGALPAYGSGAVDESDIGVPRLVVSDDPACGRGHEPTAGGERLAEKVPCFRMRADIRSRHRAIGVHQPDPEIV